MKPFNPGGHISCQNHVLKQLHIYYSDAISSLPPISTWEIMEKSWNLDLSPLDLIMQDRYSKFSPTTRLPSDMIRSILLSAEVKTPPYTNWAADLKVNHSYAILSGFMSVIKIRFACGAPTCTCKKPCSDARYGKTAHLIMKNNPRIFLMPHYSREWKLEYNARISVERCNKREKIDFKPEDGRYRSTMMCQRLDA